MKANDRQVGGSHYQTKIEHWDFVIANDLDYFQAQITKYVTRWKKKGGIQDLQKAQHFLEKYLEAIQAGQIKYGPPMLADAKIPPSAALGGLCGGPTSGYVDQDR